MNPVRDNSGLQIYEQRTLIFKSSNNNNNNNNTFITHYTGQLQKQTVLRVRTKILIGKEKN